MMPCPRRGELGVMSQATDKWRDDKTCSYCGSLHPDEFFRLVEAGEEVTPTDKNYKAYVSGSTSPSGKFYFQHLNEQEKQKFVDLLNQKKMKLQHPGYFYARPFFVTVTKP